MSNYDAMIAIANDHPNIENYSAANYRDHTHSRGLAWNCDIMRNGEKVGYAENEGRGGQTDLFFEGMRLRERPDDWAEMEAAIGGSEAWDPIIEALLRRAGV